METVIQKPEHQETETGMTERGKRNSLAYPTSQCCGTHRRNTEMWGMPTPDT